MRAINLLALFAALLLGGCSNEPVNQPTRRISQPQVAARPYQTFYIQPVRSKGHRVDLEERFNTAMQRALVAKGYRPQDGTGDMLVIYSLGTLAQDGIELRPVMGANGAIYTQTQMTDEQTAVLALRILDPRDQRVLFQAQISRQFTNPKFAQEGFDQTVAQLLEDFPPRKP